MTTTAVEVSKKNLQETLVNLLLNDKSIQLSDLETTAKSLAPILARGLSEQDILDVVEGITELRQVTLNLGPGVVNPGTFHEWLNTREKTNLKQWNAYRHLLVRRGWSPTVIEKLDEQTSIIVERMGDPTAIGEWARRGLVIGEVQSGKTATYLGVLNKAIDYGYKIIVVIGGHTEDLRRQTQQRIDRDLTGLDSIYLAENLDSNAFNMRIGVGEIDPTIVSNVLTTTRTDFHAANKNAGVVALASDTPTVFVVKKNAQVLTNLANYLIGQAHNGKLTAPLVLIDDEADWASVNTKSEKEIAPVNKVIRRVLETSSRSSYVGITATPFANVLIDDTIAADLFPRDYIQALESPSNYSGVEAYFGRDNDALVQKRVHIDVEDCLEILPFNHKRSAVIDDLPPSLISAINTFLVGTAIRRLRDGRKNPASMMINVSRFNHVQASVTAAVNHFIDQLCRSVQAEFSLPVHTFSQNTNLTAELKRAFDVEFADAEDWATVRSMLVSVVEEVKVALVNSGTMGPRNKHLGEMSREDRDAEARLPTIYIGGDVLARGLTLEGLQVSYFVRRAGAADTLLQMGRWFGYRPNYEDLVRIWIDATVVDLFKYVADLSDELRSSLRFMNALKMTPLQFGLKMRRHPDAFLITAANKQKNAVPFVGEVDINGASFESYVLSLNRADRERNSRAAVDLVKALVDRGTPDPDRKSLVWSDVPAEIVVRFFSGFRGHDTETYFGRTSDSGGNAQLANHLADGINSDSWDVGFVEGTGSVTSALQLPKELRTSIRDRLEAGAGSSVRFGNRRVAAGADLKNAMKTSVIAQLERERNAEDGEMSSKSLSERDIIRHALERPLLLIFAVTTRTKSSEIADEKHGVIDGDTSKVVIDSSDPLIAAIVAFPVSSDAEDRAGSKKNRVSLFVANPVFARLNLNLPTTEEEISEDDLL